jgi:hypothetical protein
LDAKPIDTVLFTPEVVNTPLRVENDVRAARALVSALGSERRVRNKGQRSIFFAVGTRLGVSSIVRIEITDLTILRP